MAEKTNKITPNKTKQKRTSFKGCDKKDLSYYAVVDKNETEARRT
jgi:hypothetical protein